ncbi:GLUCOSE HYPERSENSITIVE 1, LOW PHOTOSYNTHETIC EFFICIENCY2 [Hibiscus trionum]|uniref:GLUCOSE HYPERSENSITIVE 1, LOW PHOTOSYNTHETIC EFFICIENCY2 n=1 Tax=Hibiscus trionum TaxID=183268 RepID=A0A9W7HFX3_HIBTR|nr:GLUCOSE HYPERSENSITIVE 1, LOW PHOTOSYNTHETIC EFFICIENCY2 [Hibiscus trionum]
MAFSLTSLSKSLSFLLPSHSTTSKPSNFAPPVSQWDPKSTPTPTSLSLSLTAADEISAVTCPSLAYSNTLFFKSVCYNVQVVVGENEPEEKLLGRFRRAVFRAGVIQECKRRKFFEDPREKKKRKAREASRRNRKRRPYQKVSAQAKEEGPKKNDDEDDNWGLPEGDLPY